MMEINVPVLAESISEASIDSWLVKVGDMVATGQVIVNIETDKVMMEVPAPKDGRIEAILKQVGENVTSGELLARMDTKAIGVASTDGGKPASADAGKAVLIKVPELAESIAEASLAEWFKLPGDAVVVGEVIANIETDKVMLEVPSTVAGTLSVHHVAVGGDVTSHQLLAEIVPGAVAAAKVPVVAQDEIIVSPAARKMAAEMGVDLTQVTGSGKNRRITKEDVKQAGQVSSPGQSLASPPAVARPGDARSVRREKMSKLRARVAERLLQSQQQTAMLTTFNEVDMSAVLNLRKQYRDEFEKRHGTKLGFMSFFVKAVTAALGQHPIVNAAIEGDQIAYHDYCDIGIAVGSPRGLVVPVLRDAQAMGMADVEKKIAEYGQRAQTGALELGELSGGTFTITNGGVFGSLLSTPIINPPQSAILGVHATRERPVVVDGAIVIRPMNYLALSYDHRLIDGRDAVLFLVSVKHALEDPARMILGL